MLQNMNIGRRLFFGFGIVVLFLVAAGMLAIGKIDFVHTLQQTFFEHPFTVVNALGAAHIDITKMERDVQSALLAGNPQEREAVFNHLDEAESTAFAHLKLVKERFLGDTKLVDAIMQDLGTWKNSRTRTIALLREDKKEQALALHKELSAGIIANIEKEMEEIDTFALNKATSLANDSRKTKDQTIRFTSILLLAAAAFAIAITLLITRSITRPLTRAVEVADRLAVGDISAEIGGLTGDEVGLLLRSMTKMLHQFRNMSAIATAIAAGNLSVDVAPQSDKDVMGNALDNMVVSLKNSAAIAQRIAVGDLSVNVVPQSDKDVMGNALANMVASLKNSAAIAQRIAVGDLSVNVVPQSNKDVMGNALAAMVASLREITSEIIEGVNVLASSSSEIMASTNQVASGAAETAVAVSETTSTAEEVKQTALVASQKARNVSETAQQAVQLAQIGRQSVEESIAGMGRIQGQVETIAESIVRLAEQSQTIGEIIGTVKDLAEQSNLLAVNAAIEAAKAGEQGKGFAVVAQEVKSLAEQSKEATAQVRTILGDIQKATNAAVLATEQGTKTVAEGVGQSREAGEAIRQMGDSIDESAQAAIQIAASSQQQLTGMDQMALAMENIRQASEQNVTGMRQVELTVQRLHELGQKLKDLVARYKV